MIFRKFLMFASRNAIPKFTLEVKSDNAGTSGTTQFTIPTTAGTYLYDYTTSDGQSGTGITGNTTITFASGVGTYEIYITGTFPRMYFNNGGDKLKLLRVLEWGDYGEGATDQTAAFYGCANLSSIASDVTNLNLITDATNMFREGAALSSLPSGMTLASLDVGALMFRNCLSLSSLPSGIELPLLTNGNNMFYNCAMPSLPSGMTLPLLTNGENMFFNITELASLPSGMELPLLTNGINMFRLTAITDLPAGMTLPSLSAGTNMFFGSTINTTRYSQLLVDLESGNANNSVTFHGGNSLYNAAGETARDILTGGVRLWTITDGGLEP